VSSFTDPADLRIHGPYTFEVLAPFHYHIGEYPSEEVIEVKVGFVTDLASIPRILWAVLPPHGRYAKAAIVHDYMYVQAYKTNAFADQTFKEAMGVLGVGKAQRTLMYWAVRLFGRGNYPR
jgi:hypothetical protein